MFRGYYLSASYRNRLKKTKQKEIKKLGLFFFKLWAAENDVWTLFENYERVGAWQDEGNSQDEIETFVIERKCKSTTKKAVDDIKTFKRYVVQIN